MSSVGVLKPPDPFPKKWLKEIMMLWIVHIRESMLNALEIGCSGSDMSAGHFLLTLSNVFPSQSTHPGFFTGCLTDPHEVGLVKPKRVSVTRARSHG